MVLACGGTVYILHPNAEHAIQGYGSCIQNQQAGLFPIKQPLKSEWLVVHFCERAIHSSPRSIGPRFFSRGFAAAAPASLLLEKLEEMTVEELESLGHPFKKSEGIEEWKDLVHAPWIETLGFKAKPQTFAIYRFLVAKVQTLRYDRRKFRSQTSDNMDRWKAEQGRGREKRKIRRKKSKRERVRRKKMQMREKVGKSRNTAFFQWFGAPEGGKVGSLKRRVRSQLARWEMKNCTPLWREAHFEVKMYKTHHSWTTFGSSDVEKVHAVVARSTFRSQNVQNTTFSDHFWKLRCRKSARRGGAKHMSKSTCTKHTSSGPLLAVEMSKKCTPLWREAHFEAKMYKTHHSWTTFGSSDVEKVHAVVARSTFRSQNVQNTPFSDHFWKLRCRKSARRGGAKHISKSTCTKHSSSGPLLAVEMSKKCTPLWREAHFEVKMLKTQGVRTTFGGADVEKVHAVVARSTFQSQNVQSTRGSDHFWRFRCRFASLHYTTLHYTPLHYTRGHYTTLRSTTLHYITLRYTTLNSTTLHYTILHYLPLHFTTLHYTPLHYNYNYTTTLHYTPLH